MSPVAVIRQRRKLRTESRSDPDKQAVHAVQTYGKDLEARTEPSSCKQNADGSRSSDDDYDDSYDDSFDEFDEGENASSNLTAEQLQVGNCVEPGTGSGVRPTLEFSRTTSPNDGRDSYYPGTTRKRPSSTDGQNDRSQISSTVFPGSQILKEGSRSVPSTLERGSRAQKGPRHRRPSGASKPARTVSDASKRRSRPRKLTVAAWKGQSHLEGYESDELLDEEDTSSQHEFDDNGNSTEDSWAATALRARLAASSSGGGGEAGIGMATNRRTQLWFGGGGSNGRMEEAAGRGLKAGKHLVTGLDNLGSQSVEVPKPGTMPWQRIMMSASRNAYRKRRPPR